MVKKRKPAVADELLDELLEGTDALSAFQSGDLIQDLKKALAERILNAELDHHLDDEERASCNHRNGHSSKRVVTDDGLLDLSIPRDRQGQFEPKLIEKHCRRLPGFDDKVISMYARGMSTREIQDHVQELYGIEVSPELISKVTDAVVDELKAWQSRPLESTYAIVYFDAVRMKIRDEGLVKIAANGLFSSFYSDRGSHYWLTPKAGGPVDKTQLTQFGRAMKQLGIQMIAAYSPEARGRSERFFGTLQGRLPNELALHGITDMADANDYLNSYWARFNQRFSVDAAESGNAFVAALDAPLKDILCIQEERTVRGDNCVCYGGMILQIPAQQHRCHFVKAKVTVHAYPDGTYAIFHGPRRLANYDVDGVCQFENTKQQKKAVA